MSGDRGIMYPVKVAQLAGGSHLVTRLAMRAAQMQGCPEAIYKATFPKELRDRFEHNTYMMIAALESLGCELLVPHNLSPTLPFNRDEDG